MSSIHKTRTFRPVLEFVEPRIVATAGLASLGHGPAHIESHATAKVVSIESHHPSHHSVAASSSHHGHPPKAVVGNSTVNNSTTSNTTNITNTTNNITNITNTSGTSTVSDPVPSTPVAALPTNSTSNQAWVELVNMTGHALDYQIKIGPYANGQFLDFEIDGSGSNATQYRWSSLITNGQHAQPDFAIQFDNGPVTPLQTGISQQTAQGYYIFQGSDAQYYVAPFFTMNGPS